MFFRHIDIGLSCHLQKKLGSIGPKITELWQFLYVHKEILENLAYGQIGQFVEIFKLGPRAQFLANRPNSF